MDDPNVGSEEHMKAMWAGQSNVLVAVRVRPLMKHDIIKRSCVKVLDSKLIIILDPAFGDKQDILRANRSREKQYAFDYAFDPNASQMQVYNHTTKFLIRGVLDGYNATVFAYGQTGSGKTHTMIGSPNDPGIMVRVMEDLTSYSTEQGKKEGVDYKFTVSLLEIYNENIRDLLSEVEEYLDLREDPIKGPVVAGITEVEAKNGKEIMDLLTQGNAKRSQAATAANEVSSRSHAVLQVVVESKDKASGIVANIKVGKLSLVDLAGSERAANTKNVGARLVEGANINRSLLALGNCINALGEKGNKGNFVPYRDSKLTRLLKDSLGGNCRTVMIANISSAESSFEETLNTLKYANRAKNIKTNIQRNVLNVNYHISEYVQLIDNLRGEIKALKDQIGSGVRISSAVSRGPFNIERNNSANSPMPSPIHAGLRHPTTPLHILRESMKSAASMNGANGEGRELVNMMREKIVENFQERMQLRRSLIELEDQNVQNSIEVSKRQLIVVQWSEGSNTPGKPKNEQMTRADFSAHLLANASQEIKDAWLECEQLRKAIMKNNGMKKSIAKRLRHNEREAEKFKDELTTKITGEDRRELMELQYQVGRLELENMELEQHRIVHESIVKGKDLVIQKLRLQLAVRDKIIQRQKVVLKDNSLDDMVGYTQLALMEETLMGDNEMLSSQIAPPSPPRNMADMRPKHALLIPQLEMPIRQIGFNLDDDDGPLTDIREISLTDRDRESIEAGDWSEIQSELSDNSLNDSSVRAKHSKRDVFMGDSSLENSSRMEIIAKGLGQARGQAGPRGGRHYRSTIEESSSEKLPLRPNNARSSNTNESKIEPVDDYDLAPGKSSEPLSIQAKGYYNDDPDLEGGREAQIRRRQEAAAKLQQQQQQQSKQVAKNRKNQDGGQLSPGRGNDYAIIHPSDDKETGGGIRAGGIRDMAIRGVGNNVANTKIKQQDSEKWVKAEMDMQLGYSQESNQKPFDFQQPPQVAKYFANQNPANQQNAFKGNYQERQGYRLNKQEIVNDDFGEDSVDTIHSDDNSEYSEGGRSKYGNKQLQLQGRGYDLDENGQPKKSVNKNLVLGKLKNRLVNNGPVLGQYGGPNLGMPTNNLGMPQSIAPAPGNYSERPQNPITAGIIASAGSFQDRIPSGQNLGLMGPGLGGISRPGPKVKLGGPVRDGRREITNPKLLTKQPSDVSNNPPMQGGLGGVIVPNIGGRNRSLPNLPKGNAGPDSARSQGAKGGKN